MIVKYQTKCNFLADVPYYRTTTWPPQTAPFPTSSTMTSGAPHWPTRGHTSPTDPSHLSHTRSTTSSADIKRFTFIWSTCFYTVWPRFSLSFSPADFSMVKTVSHCFCQVFCSLFIPFIPKLWLALSAGRICCRPFLLWWLFWLMTDMSSIENRLIWLFPFGYTFLLLLSALHWLC